MRDVDSGEEDGEGEGREEHGRRKGENGDLTARAAILR